MAHTAFTARQGEYLAFIHRFTLKHGVAPSFEEIAARFGTSSPSANGMIRTLERHAWLSRVPGVARSLRVLAPKPPPRATSRVGRIRRAASAPGRSFWRAPSRWTCSPVPPARDG